MIEEIKKLMKEYYHALVAAERAKDIRAQLINLLRDSEWEKTPFKFADRTLTYHQVDAPSGLTQRHIKTVLQHEYPEIADEVMSKILAARTRKISETIIQRKTQAAAPSRTNDNSDIMVKKFKV